MEHNHLAGETSPYLQQHADNPVAWYPWGDEALQKAKDENKPILLSIGYSACHWCHVMAHESFEDATTAAVMNDLFVNIKVDREERPDLDKIYQLSYQILMGRPGGWPLNMFLTPDRLIPFFGGTYFPDRPAYDLPAFVDVLRQVAAYYHEQKIHLAEQAAQFQRTLNVLSAPSAPKPAQKKVLAAARRELELQFDVEHGGFGQAPKFPNGSTVEFLLRHWEAEGKTDGGALHMATKSLEQMASGGIYDQLGGGFCRYSVDERWQIPHFEKMLYDNGQLLALYAQGWQATGTSLFEKTATETAAWVMETMQSPDGGYSSSLDADSDGEEGEYYVWRHQEVKAILSDDEWLVASRHFGLNRPANFGARWNLFIAEPCEVVAHSLGMEADRVQGLLRSARSKLRAARERRNRPARDEKILTSWNALMIRGMAIAGRVFEREDFIDSAERAFIFLRANLWRNGRLLATFKDGKAHLNAYLDDYVHLLDAGLTLLQVRWKREYLDWLVELADCLRDHYEDTGHGGFFFTADDHETLPLRPKPFADDAMPAGNAVAASALGRLGRLLNSQPYLDASQRCIAAAMDAIARMPHAHCAFLSALEESLLPHATIIVRGKEALHWQQALGRDFCPRRFCIAIPKPEESDLPGSLAAVPPLENTAAYLCSESGCQPPFTDLEQLQAALIQNIMW